MPVGSSVKSRKKEDVSQKVQEIKQRQQNWLKQREQSKQEETAPRPKAAVPGQSKSAKTSSPVKPAGPRSSSYTATRIPATGAEKPNVRDKFKHWINARNKPQTQEEEDTDFNESNSIRSGAESELERLVSPEPHSTAEPVAEEHFSNLAEKIASRVKEGMGLSHTESHLSESSASTELTLLEDEKPAWDSTRCRTFTQEVPTFNHLGTSGLTSHSCMVCKKLMLSSKHIPMMVIPCGHTLCKSCSEGRQTCPSCDCPVVSLTVNIMLQQVIQEYHAHPVPSSFAAESSERSSSKDKVSARDNGYTPVKYVEDNRRNRMASYKAQLANLETRHNILTAEHSTLLNKQKQVINRLRQEQTQARSIKQQEEEVEKSISNLQERLKALKEHRKHYDVQVSELQDEKTEVDGKITMLSTTISSLVREMEKVKLLSEGEDKMGL